MIVACITARMQSTRIPNKVIAPLCGRPMLDWIYDRLAKCRMVDRIVLATNNTSEPLIQWAHQKLSPRVYVTVGKDDDVLDRLHQAAREHEASKLIRITGDLPFLSYEGVDSLCYHLTEDVDYCNNIYGPQPWLDGASAEIAWSDAVVKANRMTPYSCGVQTRSDIRVDGTWRSHGFYWMANSPAFTRKIIDSEHDAKELPGLLVDEPADLRVAEFVMGKVLAADDSYITLIKIVRENQDEIRRIRAI